MGAPSTSVAGRRTAPAGASQVSRNARTMRSEDPQMRINSAAAAALVTCGLGLAPLGALAQPQVGATELARARMLLETSTAELSAEQFALLSRRLAAVEVAYMELTNVARASQAVATVAEGSTAAASAQATATGGRALLSGAAELLPLLILLWPATAHAPGVKQETPEVRAARSKVEESLQKLAQAARQVESERAAAAREHGASLKDTPRRYGPNQTCDDSVLDHLQAEKDRLCNDMPGESCSSRKVSPKRLAQRPCSEIRGRIRAFESCLRIREQIQAQCFGSRPDQAHRDAIEDVQRGMEACRALEAVNCAQGHPMSGR